MQQHHGLFEASHAVVICKPSISALLKVTLEAMAETGL
jgi:hypothetical protein